MVKLYTLHNMQHDDQRNGTIFEKNKPTYNDCAKIRAYASGYSWEWTLIKFAFLLYL